MATVNSKNLVDISRIAEWTGINRKTVSSWANKQDKLPQVETNVSHYKVFDWAVVRPLLVDLSEDVTGSRPVSKWPRAKAVPK